MLFKFYTIIKLLSLDLFKEICFLAWSRDAVNLRFYLIITILNETTFKEWEEKIYSILQQDWIELELSFDDSEGTLWKHRVLGLMLGKSVIFEKKLWKVPVNVELLVIGGQVNRLLFIQWNIAIEILYIYFSLVLQKAAFFGILFQTR